MGSTQALGTAPASDRPTVLLTMGDYFGTLAAMRSLGAGGYAMVLADPHEKTASGVSRYLSSYHKCPPMSDWEAFLPWLLEYGVKNPGHFLYPTCDDAAWLFAKHSNSLSQHFMMAPGLCDSIYCMLNKRLLSEAAAACGLASPVLHQPTCDEDLQGIIGRVDGDWIAKPVTQIGLRIAKKGTFLGSGAQAVRRYKAFQGQLRYAPQIQSADPQVIWPIVQRFYRACESSIISIAGFIAPCGEMIAVSSRKVLQFPRSFGTGICFESIPLDQQLGEKLARLLRIIGYCGVFEVEFIPDPVTNRHLIIDANPRFYGQMGFEIARGLPLPQLALAMARGDAVGLARGLSEARAHTNYVNCRYGNRFMLDLVLAGGRLRGSYTSAERQRWRQFPSPVEAPYFDALDSPGDPAPLAQVRRSTILKSLRHPRDSFRKYILGV